MCELIISWLSDAQYPAIAAKIFRDPSVHDAQDASEQDEDVAREALRVQDDTAADVVRLRALRKVYQASNRRVRCYLPTVAWLAWHDVELTFLSVRMQCESGSALAELRAAQRRMLWVPWH